MKHQDNPFARGLSVNEDVMNEDCFEPVRVNKHPTNEIVTEVYECGDRRVVINIDLSSTKRCLEKSLDRLRDNYRSGLALTNPEE